MIKGLSGGEKKRLAIGVEMITNPKILFLDEPTSGLDSFSSYKLIKLLKEQAGRGKMIISTIHQPSSQTFGLFDRLILMCDGNIVYQGLASAASHYFGSIGFPCPATYNPADHFLRVLDVPYPRTSEIEEKLDTLTTSYFDVIKRDLDEEEKDFTFDPGDFNELSFKRANFMKQLSLLSQRAFKGFIRNPRILRTRILQTVIMAFLVISLFWKLGDETNEDFRNKGALIMFLSI
jgi:ABC-type multidrug transport system ATPase subunit